MRLPSNIKELNFSTFDPKVSILGVNVDQISVVTNGPMVQRLWPTGRGGGFSNFGSNLEREATRARAASRSASALAASARASFITLPPADANETSLRAIFANQAGLHVACVQFSLSCLEERSQNIWALVTLIDRQNFSQPLGLGQLRKPILFARMDGSSARCTLELEPIDISKALGADLMTSKGLGALPKQSLRGRMELVAMAPGGPKNVQRNPYTIMHAAAK